VIDWGVETNRTVGTVRDNKGLSCYGLLGRRGTLGQERIRGMRPTFFGGVGMLVLSRKRNEGICIGNGVVVRVVDVRGDRVRLGVVAPLDVQVRREELPERGPVVAEVQAVGHVPELPAVPFDDQSADVMRPLLGVPFDA